ncbi:unnamed protein product, partial [Prorocentrum cordatum]
ARRGEPSPKFRRFQPGSPRWSQDQPQEQRRVPCHGCQGEHPKLRRFQPSSPRWSQDQPQEQRWAPDHGHQVRAPERALTATALRPSHLLAARAGRQAQQRPQQRRVERHGAPVRVPSAHVLLCRAAEGVLGRSRGRRRRLRAVG